MQHPYRPSCATEPAPVSSRTDLRTRRQGKAPEPFGEREAMVYWSWGRTPSGKYSYWGDDSGVAFAEDHGELDNVLAAPNMQGHAVARFVLADQLTQLVEVGDLFLTEA